MIPYLPESAPFPPAQRAWLNGFFAGLLSGATPVAGAASIPGLGVPGLSPPGPAAAGLASGGAEGVVPLAPPPAVEETFPWHDPNLTMDERLSLADGKPQSRKLMAAMAQLDCGSCGYLCQSYAEAIAEGKEKNLKLCSPGGKETAAKLKQLVQLGAPTAAAPASLPANGGASGPAPAGTKAVAAGYSAKTPVAAKFRRAVKLNREGGDKDVRQIVIDLAGTGLHYEPGDSLGVLPLNCPVLAPRALELLGTAADAAIEIDGETLSAAAWLRTRKSITEISSEALAVLAQAAASPEEAQTLRSWSDGGEGLPEGLDVVEALERFPSARPNFAAFAAALDDLRPRLYSISSSLRAHPDEVHLTVGLVRYGLRNRLRKGVASNHLGDHCEEGATVQVYIQKSHGFRLPKDPSVGAVMIGPGTGIAPFRAFLEERKAIGAQGRNWLFFGDQRSKTDFLYEDELTAYRQEGWLARLDLAFSRDQAEKVYVQHRMLEQAAELWKWLAGGAHLYVCGDAQRMAKDVDRTLHAIARDHGGMSEEAAKKWIADLGKAGRYQRDVY